MIKYNKYLKDNEHSLYLAHNLRLHDEILEQTKTTHVDHSKYTGKIFKLQW
jgi:hypothetical protein